MKKCFIRRCDRKAEKRLMCRAHYKRWKDHGDSFDRSPIVNIYSVEDRFKAKLSKPDKNGCILWKGWKNNHGYGKFSIGKKYKFAHRMAYELFVSTIPIDLQVLHKCDVRDCCNIDHLYVGTHADNMRDVSERNRHNNVGSKNGHAKLNEKDALYIKEALRLKTKTCAQLARDFNTSESCMHDIKHGRSWRDLK